MGREPRACPVVAFERGGNRGRAPVCGWHPCRPDNDAPAEAPGEPRELLLDQRGGPRGACAVRSARRSPSSAVRAGGVLELVAFS
eukprot:4995031-Pyramimonas_sp.AAC.1